MDEYAAVYKALAVPTQTRGPIAPSEVDRLEIPIVAALLGIPADPLRSTDVHVLSANLNHERMLRAEAAQAQARAEGREITLAEAELEAGTSWQNLVQ